MPDGRSSPAEPRSPDLREPAGWRRTKNRIMTTLMVIAFVVVVVPLGFVLLHRGRQGRLDAISWPFLTSHTIPPHRAAPPNIRA